MASPDLRSDNIITIVIKLDLIGKREHFNNMNDFFSQLNSILLRMSSDLLRDNVFGLFFRGFLFH